MAIKLNSKGEMTLTARQTANLIHLFTQLVYDDNDFADQIADMLGVSEDDVIDFVNAYRLLGYKSEGLQDDELILLFMSHVAKKSVFN